MPSISEKYRVCKKCAVHHYENCGTCFGFGVYELETRPGELSPVIADEAINTHIFRGTLKPCPECKSTEKGLPHE